MKYVADSMKVRFHMEEVSYIGKFRLIEICIHILYTYKTYKYGYRVYRSHKAYLHMLT